MINDQKYFHLIYRFINNYKPMFYIKTIKVCVCACVCTCARMLCVYERGGGPDCDLLSILLTPAFRDDPIHVSVQDRPTGGLHQST